MSEENNNAIVLPDEVIMNKIFIVRGQKVMIDSDLAKLYEIPTKRLNEQVKRNIKRFPVHFMFELTKEEKDELVAKCDHLKMLKHSSSLPNVFTHYGVLQAANVLNSDRAILMGNRIIEVFVRMHEMLSTHKEILQKIDQLIEKDTVQDKEISLIFDYIQQLEETKKQEIEHQNRKKIGFKNTEEE